MTSDVNNSSLVGDLVRWSVNSSSGRLVLALAIAAVAISVLVASGAIGIFGVAVLAAAEGSALILGGMGLITISGVGIGISALLFSSSLHHLIETYNLSMKGA